MKHIPALALAASLFILSCNNAHEVKNEGPDSTDNTGEVIEEATSPLPDIKNAFPYVYDYFLRQDPSFSSRRFDSGLIIVSEQLPAQPVKESWIIAFKPFLVFNNDSSLAIDYVSGNYVLVNKKGKPQLQAAGPDTEVALVDIKGRTRKRILFLGSMATVMDAVWENPHTIIMAGSEEISRDHLRPLMWRYEYGKDTVFYFPCVDTLHASVNNFTEEKLTRALQVRTSPSF